MNKGVRLNRIALRAAIETRMRLSIDQEDPICIYDVAQKLELEVKFQGGSSFGGMYFKDRETVIVPALRPPGRQALTCAHEMGHWRFKHGTRIDEASEIQGELKNPDERVATLYASYLLMPREAVDRAFSRRKMLPQSCSPIGVYEVSGQLGVGYATLIHHLRWSVRRISAGHARELLKINPKELRAQVLGDCESQHLIIASKVWEKVPVDLRVGDYAVLPHAAVVEGTSVELVGSCSIGKIIRAILPGRSRAECVKSGWACFIRVCRMNYVGQSRFRHEEDPDAEPLANSH